MRYDPHTVYSATVAWWLRTCPDADPVQLGRARALQIRIYVQERGDGCYYFCGSPKLYWEPQPGDGFQNTAQGGLELNADKLGHVIVRDRLSRAERFWPTWAEFTTEVGIDKL